MAPTEQIFLLREADRLPQGRHIDIESRDHVVNPHCRKYLRRAIRLIRFHPNFIPGNLLVIFLAQNRGNATSERRAAD